VKMGKRASDCCKYLLDGFDKTDRQTDNCLLHSHGYYVSVRTKIIRSLKT
jgi:hypothetical protein